MPLTRGALEGVHCALVTPVDGDGNVDRSAAHGLVGFLLDAGIRGLVPVGGTGEYPALSPRARRTMVEATVEAASGRVPVVAGVLSPGFEEGAQAGRDFKAAGADGLLLITPYYTAPTQAGIRAFFRSYAEAVELPLLLYDMPSRTGVAASPDTVAAMVDDGSIVGMKVCNHDLSQFIRLMAQVGDRIAVMSGEEPLFATHVAMGATGGILATSNMVPCLWNEIYEAASRGELRRALAMQDELHPFLIAVFGETNPGPLKSAMSIVDLDMGDVMLPLLPPNESTVARLQTILPKITARERAARARG
jgi:4-hydroxy-tetrahydrodipicolinate synthase